MLRPFRLLSFQPKMSLKEAHQILEFPYYSQKTKLVGDNHSGYLNKNILFNRYAVLMAINHPDVGGSPKLAQKINEARDFIMKKYF